MTHGDWASEPGLRDDEADARDAEAHRAVVAGSPEPISDEDVERIALNLVGMVPHNRSYVLNRDVLGLLTRLAAAEAAAPPDGLRAVEAGDASGWRHTVGCTRIATGWSGPPASSCSCGLGAFRAILAAPATGDPDEVTDLAGLRAVLATEGDADEFVAGLRMLANALVKPMECTQPGYGHPGAVGGHCAACCYGTGLVITCDEEQAIVDAASALHRAADLNDPAKNDRLAPAAVPTEEPDPDA